jgi:hypothetical protein
MAFPTLSTYSDGETPADTKLNEIISAVQAAFAAGIIGANIADPLVMQGDIDMNGYSLNNFSSLNKVQVVNSSLSLDTAIANAASSGRVILIEPGYTATAEDIDVSLSNITILGYGHSSVINVPNTATYGINVTGDNFRMANLQVTSALAAADIVDIYGSNNTIVENCYFNGVGNLLVIDYTTEYIVIKNNIFNGGVTSTDYGLSIKNADNAVVCGNIFDGFSALSALKATITTDTNGLKIADNVGYDQDMSINFNSGLGVTGCSITGNNFRTFLGEQLDDFIISDNNFTTDFTATSCDGARIVDNRVGGDMLVDGASSTCVISDNTVEGTFELGSSVATQMFSNNAIIGASDFNASDVYVCMGNYFYGATTGLLASVSGVSGVPDGTTIDVTDANFFGNPGTST